MLFVSAARERGGCQVGTCWVDDTYHYGKVVRLIKVKRNEGGGVMQVKVVE